MAPPKTPLKPLKADCYLPDSLSIFATFLSSSPCRSKCNVVIQSAMNNARRCTYALHLSRFPGLASFSLSLISVFPSRSFSRQRAPFLHQFRSRSSRQARDARWEPRCFRSETFLLRSSWKRMTRRAVRNSWET